MSGPARRTWTTVSDSPEIIRTLASAALQIFRFRHVLMQLPHIGGEIVETQCTQVPAGASGSSMIKA